MPRLDLRSIKETLNIDLGSARDDDFEPWSMCGDVGKSPQESWTLLGVATFVECVNHKNKSALWVARKGAEEIKEERVPHRLRCQVWVTAEMVCNGGSKRGKDSREFVDESGKDISELAQIRVIPSAEERPSKVLSTVEEFADRMSQRCFADAGWAMNPVGIPP